MRCSMEHRQHQVLKILILFKMLDLEALLLQLISRDVAAMTLEVAVG